MTIQHDVAYHQQIPSYMEPDMSHVCALIDGKSVCLKYSLDASDQIHTGSTNTVIGLAYQECIYN